MNRGGEHVVRRREQADDGGRLGFDYKRNMGWMNDHTALLHEGADLRRYHHSDLTFACSIQYGGEFS